MEIHINWLAVVLATIVGMVVAMAWYAEFAGGKYNFANAWRRLTGVSKKDSAKAGKTPMLILALANLITAIGLAMAISVSSTFFNNNSVWLALAVGSLAWLGFSATTLAQHNAFELKPKKLTYINNGYQLALFLGMALVIGLVK
jgi:hypothetical protein